MAKAQKQDDYEVENEEDLNSPEDDEDDEHLAEGGEVEGDDSDDGSVTEDEANGDDNDREAIRARRRQERHDKKTAQREREESLRRELSARDEVINQLQSRVAIVERTHQGSEEAQIDTAINDSATAYNYFKQQIAVAAQANDGMGIADATEKMILAQRRYEDLNKVKAGYQQSKTGPAPLDPRLVHNAKNWMDKNTWYDPNGSDADSRRALEIDRELAREGWVPTTPQYWEELEIRVKKNLPHIGKTQYNKTNSRSVVGGSGRESAPSGNAGTYKLSADRVAAIKESGKWDNPTERAAIINAYKQYDRANGQK